MSIVINGIGMPADCTRCPCSDDETRFCRAANKYIPMLGKPKFCPLAEIITCKDCKYSDENWRRVSVRWLPCMDVRTGSNWFCGSAERKGEQP